MTKPPPPHGERARYIRGCRCDACSDANYRYMSRLRLEYEHGHTRRVNSAPVADHVRTLLTAGWNQRQIADAARCAQRIIGSLATDSQPTTHGDIAARILAIKPHPVPPPAQYADATGTTRRVRALVAIGYPVSHLATAIGIWPANLSRIARGDLAQVTVGTANATARVYRELSRRPGPSQRTRIRAQREGWHGPLAWEDIDNPDEQPDTADVPDAELKRDELAARRRAEIELLHTACLTDDEIAARVGVATSTVHGIRTELRRGAKRDRTKQAAA